MDLVQNHSFGKNITTFKMHTEKLKFCLSLYTKLHNRKVVQDAIDKCQFFISDLFLPFLYQQLQLHIKDKTTLNLILNVFKQHKTPFEPFSTEIRRFNIFRSDSIYVDPIQYEISKKNVKEFITETCKQQVICQPVYGTCIPIHKTLKVFFEFFV